MLIDTGSAVSILPLLLYNKHLSHFPLKESTTTLRDFSKAVIKVNGIVDTMVQFGDRQVTATFFVVDGGSAILGMDLLRTLDMHITVAEQLCCQVSSLGSPCGPNFLSDFTCLFNGDIGRAKGFEHEVRLRESVVPVQQKLRRLPLAVRDKVSTELKKQEQQYIIERIDTSECVSPIVVVRKRNGDIRMCIDLRKPNETNVVDGHPWPHVDELFHNLAGATYFSRLDMSAAYHQLPLSEESRNITAVVTHGGLYRYKRVCFGLFLAPAAFQKMMTQVLEGCSGTLNYLHDILVYGRTKADDDINLRNVLKRFLQLGLQLNRN